MPKVYIMIDDGFIREFFDPRSSWVDEYDSKYSVKKCNLAKINRYIHTKLTDGDYRYSESEIRELGIDCFEAHKRVIDTHKLELDYFKTHNLETFVGMVTVNLTLNKNAICSFDIIQIEWTDGMGFQWLLTRDKNRFRVASQRTNESSNFWGQQQDTQHKVNDIKRSTRSDTVKTPVKNKKQLLEKYIANLIEKQQKCPFYDPLIFAERFLLRLHRDDIDHVFNYVLKTDDALRQHIYKDSDGNTFGTIFEIAELLGKESNIEPSNPYDGDGFCFNTLT